METFGLDKIVHSPMDYVDGDWSDIFTSDPFKLELVFIIPIYHRLYNSGNTGTPFAFKKIMDDVEGCKNSGGVLPLPSADVATSSESVVTLIAQDDSGATAVHGESTSVFEPSPRTTA